MLEVVEHGAQKCGAVLGEPMDGWLTVTRPLEVPRRHLVVVRHCVGFPDLVWALDVVIIYGKGEYCQRKAGLIPQLPRVLD